MLLSSLMISRGLALPTLLVAVFLSAPLASASTIVVAVVNLNATSASGATQTIQINPGTYYYQVVGTGYSGALYNGWSASGSNYTDSWDFQSVGDLYNINISGNPTYPTAIAAYNAISAATNLVETDVTTSTVAASGFSNLVTINSSSVHNVTFTIPDSGSYSTASGGVSILVTESTPEPSTLLLLASALLLGFVAFRKRLPHLANLRRSA